MEEATFQTILDIGQVLYREKNIMNLMDMKIVSLLSVISSRLEDDNQHVDAAYSVLAEFREHVRFLDVVNATPVDRDLLVKNLYSLMPALDSAFEMLQDHLDHITDDDLPVHLQQRQGVSVEGLKANLSELISMVRESGLIEACKDAYLESKHAAMFRCLSDGSNIVLVFKDSARKNGRFRAVLNVNLSPADRDGAFAEIEDSLRMVFSENVRQVGFKRVGENTLSIRNAPLDMDHFLTQCSSGPN